VKALLGIAQSHLGKYSAASKNLDFALRNGTKYKPRVLYYLGIAYSMLGREQSASAAFERLLSGYPDSPEAKKVASPRQLRLIREPARAAGKEKEPDKLRLLFIQDVSHDTNASLTTDPDSDTVLFTFASIRLSLHPVPVFLKGSFMMQEYFDEDDFDLVYIAGSAQGRLELTQRDTLYPAYTLKNLWLADKDLGSGNRAELLWERGWGRSFFSDAAASYDQNYFDENYNDKVTGDRTEGRARAWWKPENLGPLTRIRAGLLLTDSTAEEDHLAYRSWQAGGDIELTLGKGVTLDLEASFGERNYDETDPDHGIVRYDQRVKLGASFLAQLDENIYLRLNIHHLASDSNIKEHSYHQTVYGIGLMLMF
jgi:hypothetical protein